MAIDVCVIQVGRLPIKRREIMERIEHLLALAVDPLVPGDEAPITEHFDPIDIRLHRHRLKGMPTGHAVAVLLPGDRLILVDLAAGAYRGIECTVWQRQSVFFLDGKKLANRLALAGDGPFLILQAASEQVGVQVGQVVYLRHRRRPTAFEQFYAVLDERLLVTSGRQAKERFEVVVAGQPLPTRVELPLPSLEDRRRHGPRVIPPQLLGNTAEKRHGTDRAVEDRFGLLAGQGDPEGGVRPGPRDEQHWDLPASIGEVGPDVAKIRFRPLARLVRQREKRLAASAPPGGHVATHLVVAAGILLFIPQPPKDLGRRMPLLPRGRFVLAENLLNPLLIGLGQHPPRPILRERVRLRLGVFEDLADLPPRMTETPGNLVNAHPIAMSTPNPCVILHLQHP